MNTMGAKSYILAAAVLAVVLGSMWVGARLERAGSVEDALEAVTKAKENANEVDKLDSSGLLDALTGGVQ